MAKIEWMHLRPTVIVTSLLLLAINSVLIFYMPASIEYLDSKPHGIRLLGVLALYVTVIFRRVYQMLTSNDVDSFTLGVTFTLIGPALLYALHMEIKNPQMRLAIFPTMLFYYLYASGALVYATKEFDARKDVGVASALLIGLNFLPLYLSYRASGL